MTPVTLLWDSKTYGPIISFLEQAGLRFCGVWSCWLLAHWSTIVQRQSARASCSGSLGFHACGVPLGHLVAQLSLFSVCLLAVKILTSAKFLFRISGMKPKVGFSFLYFNS